MRLLVVNYFRKTLHFKSITLFVKISTFRSCKFTDQKILENVTIFLCFCSFETWSIFLYKKEIALDIVKFSGKCSWTQFFEQWNTFNSLEKSGLNQKKRWWRTCRLTPYSPVLLFYTPWKHQNLKVFWCFQGYRKATPGCNGLSFEKSKNLWKCWLQR